MFLESFPDNDRPDVITRCSFSIMHLHLIASLSGSSTGVGVGRAECHPGEPQPPDRGASPILAVAPTIDSFARTRTPYRLLAAAGGGTGYFVGGRPFPACFCSFQAYMTARPEHISAGQYSSAAIVIAPVHQQLGAPVAFTTLAHRLTTAVLRYSSYLRNSISRTLTAVCYPHLWRLRSCRRP